MERLVKRMKLHRVSGTIVHHCALMIRYLEHTGKKAHIVKGWVVYGNEACTHYWVEDTEGAVYDVGYSLGCMYNPELMALSPRIHRIEPVGVKFADENEPALKGEHLRQYELYLEDKQTFWKESPADVRNFRVL